MTQPEPVDRTTFDELRSTTGDDFVRELVETFLAEAPRMLDELRAAYADGDAERFRRAAHSLKSNANTFGALVLGKLARDVELGGLPQAQAAGGKAIEDLADEYGRVSRTLQDMTRG